MKTVPLTDPSVVPQAGPRVEFSADVLQQIRQHARSSMSAEICGVLLGDIDNAATRVTTRIEGTGAAQGGAHVTFTQDTWEHIYKVKDSQFPSHLIVGWYHSHPGFGIFLSDYDLFIHENFFNAPHQIAWVFDPHSDEEGCFGWAGKKVEPLSEVVVLRKLRPPTSEHPQVEASIRNSQRAADVVSVAKNINYHEQSNRIFWTMIIALLAFLFGFFIRPYIGNFKQAPSTVIKVPNQPSGTSWRAGPMPCLPFTTNQVIRFSVVPVETTPTVVHRENTPTTVKQTDNSQSNDHP